MSVHRRRPSKRILTINLVAAFSASWADLALRNCKGLGPPQMMVGVVHRKKSVVDVIGIPDPFDCEDQIPRFRGALFIPKRCLSVGLVPKRLRKWRDVRTRRGGP